MAFLNSVLLSDIKIKDLKLHYYSSNYLIINLAEDLIMHNYSIF